MTGRIIVFEGLDGVGKTTLSRALATRLDAVWLTTPDPEVRAVRGLVDERWGPDERALFYAGSVLHAGRRAAALAAGGRDVVVDRYWLSTWVYARAAGATVDLAAIEPELVAPDVTVMVVADEGVRRQRLHQRDPSSGDLASLRHAAELRRLYDLGLARAIAGQVLTLDSSSDGATLAARLELELEPLPFSRHSAQIPLFEHASPTAHELQESSWPSTNLVRAVRSSVRVRATADRRQQRVEGDRGRRTSLRRT